MNAHGGAGRTAALDDFLAGAGRAESRRQTIPGDASGRRYLRLGPPGVPAVAMDWPPPQDSARFAALAGRLRALGLQAPEILARDTDRGFLLLEDLGAETFAARLDAGADAAPLYALAVDVLIALRRAGVAAAEGLDLPVFDAARFTDQATLFLDVAWPAVCGRAAAADEREAFATAWRPVLSVLADAAPVLMLRDYFPGNLVWRPGAAGLARAGLLDFQDAGIGPAEYDLMSLLEDARRPVDPDLADAMRARYAIAFPADAPGDARRRFDALAAARHVRVLAVFTRLQQVGRTGYGEFLPHVRAMLRRVLRRPGLEPLAGWFDDAPPGLL